MQSVLVTLQILVFLGIPAALACPKLRRGVAAGLLLIGLAALVAAGIAETGTRSLEISHRFSAYVDLTVQNKVFPIETAVAPSHLWLVLVAAFVLGWAAWLGRRRPAAETGDRTGAMREPLALCWTGAALMLALEKAAAPAALFVPFDLAPDRILFPATLVGAMLLARPGQKILHLVYYLTLFVAVTRLPLAVFGTLATRGHWGTHLDVHGTDYFVPPGGGATIGGITPIPGSAEQLFWLVWAPQLILYPMFYLMSTAGFAFLRLMWERQREVDRAEA